MNTVSHNSVAGTETMRSLSSFKTKQTFIPDIDKNNANQFKIQMSYKKYSLKNKKNQDIRPFYLWKEGFIENYKKYCHKD